MINNYVFKNAASDLTVVYGHWEWPHVKQAKNTQEKTRTKQSAHKIRHSDDM